MRGNLKHSADVALLYRRRLTSTYILILHSRVCTAIVLVMVDEPVKFRIPGLRDIFPASLTAPVFDGFNRTRCDLDIYESRAQYCRWSRRGR